MFGRGDLVDSCAYGSCFTELMIQLAIIFVGKQFVNQAQELAVPWLMAMINRAKERRERAQLAQHFIGVWARPQATAPGGGGGGAGPPGRRL